MKDYEEGEEGNEVGAGEGPQYFPGCLQGTFMGKRTFEWIKSISFRIHVLSFDCFFH